MARLDEISATYYFSYLCFVFIIVDLMCNMYVFCVIVIIPPCMVVSFLLGSLSMVIDFPCRFRSIMVVFHPKAMIGSRKLKISTAACGIAERNSFNW